MEKKKKFIHRIGAVVCALVVAVSCFGSNGSYYASESVYIPLYPYDDLSSVVSRSQYYTRYLVFKDLTDEKIYMWCISSEYSVYFSYGEIYKQDGDWLRCGGGCVRFVLQNDDWVLTNNTTVNYPSVISGSFDILGCSEDVLNYYYSNGYKTDGLVYYSSNPIEFGENLVSGDSYNSSLGYLQNIKTQNLYLRGEASIGGIDLPLYYDDAVNTLKKVWSYDLTTTSGVNLSSGSYSVRHYVKEATVKGYKKDDIIEMSDMYLMGEYTANGRFEYMEVEHDKKLESLGYNGLTWIEKYLKGYFQLEHHYFQIVNTSTNEVGGYLHVFPQNKDGELGLEFVGNEGVELGFEGLDENLDVDPNAPSGEVGESIGHGDSYEDAEEQAIQSQLKMEGIDQFVGTMEAYASQVSNVTKGIGAFLGSFPPWVLVLLGLGVALMFVIIVVKGIRG